MQHVNEIKSPKKERKVSACARLFPSLCLLELGNRELKGRVGSSELLVSSGVRLESGLGACLVLGVNEAKKRTIT